MKKIVIRSSLDSSYINDIRDLLFFNEYQSKYVDGIMRSIHDHGMPVVNCKGNKIEIKVEGLPDVQSLFALENDDEMEKLIGVIIFFRKTIHNIVLLHIAVDKNFTANNMQLLTLTLIKELISISKSIKGIKTLTIYYNKVDTSFIINI